MIRVTIHGKAHTFTRAIDAAYFLLGLDEVTREDCQALKGEGLRLIQQGKPITTEALVEVREIVTHGEG